MAATPQSVIGALKKAGIVIQQHGLVSRNERVKRAGAKVNKAPGFKPGVILVEHADPEVLIQCADILLKDGHTLRAPTTQRILKEGDALTREEASSGAFLCFKVKAMNKDERISTVKALRAATNKLSSGLASYMYRDPVTAEEMQSIILRFAQTTVLQEEDDNAASALAFLLYAYEDAYGRSGWLSDDMAHAYAMKVYAKSGLDPVNFTWPDIIETEKGLPKWLIEMVAMTQAEDDQKLYDFARKRMAASAETEE